MLVGSLDASELAAVDSTVLAFLELRRFSIRSSGISSSTATAFFQGVYKVPYSVLWGGGSLSSLLGKNIKRGREYYGCGEDYNIEKRERGSNIIPYTLYLIPYNI